jgi:hypothetical protein
MYTLFSGAVSVADGAAAIHGTEQVLATCGAGDGDRVEPITPPPGP